MDDKDREFTLSKVIQTLIDLSKQSKNKAVRIRALTDLKKRLKMFRGKKAAGLTSEELSELWVAAERWMNEPSSQVDLFAAIKRRSD